MFVVCDGWIEREREGEGREGKGREGKKGEVSTFLRDKQLGKLRRLLSAIGGSTVLEHFVLEGEGLQRGRQTGSRGDRGAIFRLKRLTTCWDKHVRKAQNPCLKDPRAVHTVYTLTELRSPSIVSLNCLNC